MDQPLNIDVVAKKSGYSKWYLQRMFRTVTHQTLGEYIRQR
ncbi:AraC family transcriptional regulator, partial [Salmonella enterica subsp. enterica serovar Montevideo]|nr:AraC family transcriptional regulator [Salmonella enterica subsp. enterica serovar Montevideo]